MNNISSCLQIFEILAILKKSRYFSLSFSADIGRLLVSDNLDVVTVKYVSFSGMGE